MDSLQIYFSLFVILILALYLMVNYYRKNVEIYKDIPSYPILWYFFLQHLGRKIPKDLPINSYLFQKLTEIFRMYEKEGLCLIYGFRPLLFVFGEESVKVFSNSQAALDKSYKYEVVEDLLGCGLVTSNGERWKTHRKLLNPAFHFGALRDKVSIFNECAASLVEEMEPMVNQSYVDPMDSIKRCYFNSLCEAVFGLNYKNFHSRASIENYFNNLNNLGAMSVYRFSHPWLHWKFILRFIPFCRQHLKEIDEKYDFTKDIILGMKEQLIASKSGEVIDAEESDVKIRKSFVHLLLEHHLKDPSFTFEDLQGEVTTFMAAGFDTVACATMWCLFLLGLHHEIQEKAFNEVQIADDLSKGAPISYEECCSFTYLEAVLLEALRLYPAVPVYARILSEDVQCGKYKIPKDTNICFFSYLLHRDPEIYPDPEKFDPERFLSDTIKPWSYIAFSEGIRNCIGKKFALIEMKIVLAHVLRNYKITSLDRREDLNLSWDIVLIPTKPLRMRFTPRRVSEYPAL